MMALKCSSDSWRSTLNAPHEDLSAGISVFLSQVPFMAMNRSSCGRTDVSMPDLSRPEAVPAVAMAAGAEAASAPKEMGAANASDRATTSVAGRNGVKARPRVLLAVTARALQGTLGGRRRDEPGATRKWQAHGRLRGSADSSQRV